MNAPAPSQSLAHFSEASPRRLMHTRRIESQGFRREDGLWDIEARIVDTKPFAYEEPYRGHREAESDVHNIAIRLTLDDDFVVHDIEVLMPAVPYPSCAGAIPNFKLLIGVKVGAVSTPANCFFRWQRLHFKRFLAGKMRPKSSKRRSAARNAKRCVANKQDVPISWMAAIAGQVMAKWWQRSTLSSSPLKSSDP
jgi:hypothetical protein